MIYDAVHSCQTLLENEITITYKDNHKSKLNKTIIINFEESDFPHLLGIHYLDDCNQFFLGRRKQVFRRIIKHDYLKEKIQNSDHYYKIIPRLEILIDFKNFINNNSELFFYEKPNWTDIEADKVVKNFVSGKKSFFFLSRRNDVNYYVGRSIICSNEYFALSRNKKIIVDIHWEKVKKQGK